MSNSNNIQQRVLEKIRSGQVAMRPRLYFVARMALIIAVAILAFLVSVFALSFAIFSVYQSGEQFLLGFGGQGVATFLALFPWWTSLLAICLLFILEALLRNFKFAYQLPLLRFFLWALSVAVLGSILVSVTPLHSLLLERADRDGLPVIGALYENVHANHWDHGVYRGYVSSTTAATFTITHNDADLDSDDGTWVIAPPSGFDMSVISIGEKAYVAGSYENGVVQAYGIELEQPVK